MKIDKNAFEYYKRLEKDAVIELSTSDAILASNAAGACNKLQQIANGAVYTEEHSVVKIHDSKLDALEDLIESANGQSVIVFYQFRHDQSRIQERFETRELKSDKDVKDWIHLNTVKNLLRHIEIVLFFHRNAYVSYPFIDLLISIRQLIENHKWDFDMCVIDELSSFKNNQAKRFKALKKYIGRCKRVVGLTVSALLPGPLISPYCCKLDPPLRLVYRYFCLNPYPAEARIFHDLKSI